MRGDPRPTSQSRDHNITSDPRRFGWDRAAIVAGVLLLVLAAFPFDFAIDSASLHRNLHQVQLGWGPLSLSNFTPRSMAIWAVTFAFGFCTTAGLCRSSDKRSIEYVLLQAGIPAVLIEIIQLFSLSTIASGFNLLINLLFAAAGCLAACRLASPMPRQPSE